jgi:hypothetical protein
MSTTDFLVLVGIAVTAIGWVVTFLRQMAIAQAQAKFNGEVQKQLEAMKEEFALAREHRQYILPEKMAGLKRITDLLEAAYHLAYDTWLTDIVPAEYNDMTIDEITDRTMEWNKEYDKCMAIAIQYGQSTLSMSLEERIAADGWYETGTLPSNLVLVLDAVQAEIGTAVSSLTIDGHAPDRIQKAQELVEKLYLHGIKLITDLRKSIFLGNL